MPMHDAKVKSMLKRTGLITSQYMIISKMFKTIADKQQRLSILGYNKANSSTALQLFNIK